VGEIVSARGQFGRVAAGAIAKKNFFNAGVEIVATLNASKI